MNIQLKGMEFNPDVTFGRVIELSNEVKNLFSSSGYTKSLSDEKKFAVQQAINSLQADGIWDKIVKLYIPVLAGKSEEAFLNIKESYGQSNVIDTTQNGVITNIDDTNGASLSGTLTPANSKTSTGLDMQVESLKDCHFGIKIAFTNANVSNQTQFHDLADNTHNGMNFLSMQASTVFHVYGTNGEIQGATDISYPIIASLGQSYANGISYGSESGLDYQTQENGDGWQQDFGILVNPITMVAFKTWENKVVPINGVQFLTMGKGLSEDNSKKYNQIIHDLFTTLLA